MMSTQQKTDVNVIAIENNSYSCIALDDEGRVWTWGDNNNEEQLGRASAGATNRINPHNRGGQVTETVYPKENLPYILQISGSFQNTLALDREGNVWSWGRDNNFALGRPANNGRRPGKVAFPNGEKMKWIAAGYNSGKAIDTDGNIWVWGYGLQSNNGTGSNDHITNEPVMLTLDSTNAPLPKNFAKISSSDFSGYCAAMAVTEDGKIFTWGNSANAPKGGASRPRQTGFNGDIKKIDVGNGVYGFLTHSGEIWTWGDNDATANGRQGHGDMNDRAAPEKIKNVINGGTQTAPKFRDFSIYAWSMCAVDHDGNLFGCGSDNNNKHGTTGAPRVLTKYVLPQEVPEDTKVLIVAEGYYSTSHVDIYGNAYVTGNRDTFGVNDNDGSLPGRWVHFNGSGKPMFTVLSSTPTSEAKRYDTSPKTTLNAETNIASDEVKYVILYPNDTETYTDGERFYDKSFAEIEPPYYLKDTDPQLLLSPNYDLWTSRYYANPKISEDVFNAIYSTKGGSEKGVMDVVDGAARKVFTAADLVSHNCIVWVQSKNSYGTTRAIYRFDNYYTQTKAYVEGVKQSDPSFKLYQPELIGGGYGLFLDQQGNLIPGVPPFGYDIVKPMPKELTYWQLAPAGQIDEETEKDEDDGYLHRVDRSKEIFLKELSQKGDEATKTPRVTFSYEKDPAMWVSATLKFVNEEGGEVRVKIGENFDTEDFRPMFAPKGAEHVDGQDPYLPPEAEIPTTKVVGYSLTKPDGSPESYTACSFPDGFRPQLTDDNSIVYIVYSTGMLSVTESYVKKSKDGNENISNNDGLFTVVKNLQNGKNYENWGPTISGYVIVGHQVTVGSEVKDPVNYTWDQDKYVQESAKIDDITEESTVQFFYMVDGNNNNIPDEEEGTVTVRWIAVNANNASFRIAEKTFIGNGAQSATLTIEEDKENVLPTALYKPEQWIFREGQAADTAPYYPVGSGDTVSITFTVGPMEPIYFYYDEDYNENGIADKEEGFFTEKYKLAGSRGDLTPPRDDTPSKWLGGQTYSGTAPLIANYVAVGYWIEAEGILPIGTNRVDREFTGDVSAVYEIPKNDVKKNYTVTFLYKEDHNNNNIPDDEEGGVTIRWVGTTFAGNTVEMEKRVIVGYENDDVTDMIYPPNPIDEVWKLVESTVPEEVKLTRPPQVYEYRYTEVPEFATITVETTSTDGNLDFYYQFTKRLVDGAFDVIAFVIPTYRVKGYVLYDNYGNEMKSGAGDTVEVDPSIGSQRVAFVYESTITTVVVRAIDANDDTNILLSQTITDAVIGQKYAAVAPYVDDTWVLADEVLQVIDVAGGTNYITFEYEKATGNVTVLLKETDANGQIIKVLSETVGHGRIETILPPDLSEAYYTRLSTAGQTVDYSGSEPVPQTVEFYYAKDMMDVIVKAVDEADGSELKAVLYTAAARKGESYTAIAPLVDWYTLAESNSKSVYADPYAPDGSISVEFAYKKDNIGTINVRHFYKDAADNEVELKVYAAKSPVGNKFIALSESFSGFKLVNADEDTIEIIVDADTDKNSITFEYANIFTTVAVYMIDEDTSKSLAIFRHKAVTGESFTYNAPNVARYVLTSDSPVGSVNPVLPNGVSKIIFTYKKI